MLLYIEEVVAEIYSVKEYAETIKQKFDQNRPASELLVDADTLSSRIEHLEKIMPDKCNLGNARRHVNWMKRRLKEDNIESCRQDIVDIVKHDLPSGIEKIRQWASDLMYTDIELRKAIKVLIQSGEFDSAIRKAFVVLKERICAKYSLSDNLDGVDLVNTLFGRKSNYLSKMDPDEKRAHRDLFAGLFGLFRNKYAHKNSKATLTEVDTVISGINYCLKFIDESEK